MTRAFVWTLVGGAMPVGIVPPAAVLVPIHPCLRDPRVLKTFFHNLLRVVSGQWGALMVPAGAAPTFLAAPANFFRGSRGRIPGWLSGECLLGGIDSLQRMKTNRAVGVAVLLALVASFAYWLGYQHGGSSSRVTLNTPSKLKQAGLSYRHYRNDLSGPFSVNGAVAAPSSHAPER